MREDPTRRGLLYAGTQHGFYISYDDGDRWQSLRLNLPDTPVSDIWVEANDLAIATHGRGFYVLDDIGPLRQYGAPVTSATDAYLFKPGDAVRSAGAGAHQLLAEEAGAEADARDPRRQRSGRAHASTARCRMPAGRGGEAGRAGGAGATAAAQRAAASAAVQVRRRRRGTTDGDSGAR